jgi:hypothetical protein
MGRHIIQIASADGCIYVCDADKKTIRKVCSIERLEDVPDDVRETLSVVNLLPCPVKIREA